MQTPFYSSPIGHPAAYKRVLAQNGECKKKNIYIYMYIFLIEIDKYTCTYICVYIYMNIYIYMYIYAYICIYMYVYNLCMAAGTSAAHILLKNANFSAVL